MTSASIFASSFIAAFSCLNFLLFLTRWDVRERLPVGSGDGDNANIIEELSVSESSFSQRGGGGEPFLSAATLFLERLLSALVAPAF